MGNRSSSIVRGITIVVIFLVVLVVAAFVYVNRAGFIRRHVFPRIEEKIGDPVDAEDISFSLFKGVELRGLTVGADGKEWVSGGTVRIHYKLGPLLAGRLHLTQVYVDQLKITLTDAKIAELRAQLGSNPKAPATTAKAAKTDTAPAAAAASPPDLWIRDVELSDCTVEYRRTAAGPGRDELAVILEDVHAKLPELGPGKPLTFTADATGEILQGSNQARIGRAEFSLDGDLDRDLLPAGGEMQLVVAELRGQLGRLNVNGRQISGSGRLTREGDTFEISDFVVKESHDGTVEAEFHVAGTVSKNGAATLELRFLMPNDSLLGLFEEKTPTLDLGMESLSYKAMLRFQEQGRGAELDGDLALTGFTARKRGERHRRLEPLNLTSKHRVALSRADLVLHLEELSVRLNAPESQLLEVALSNPVTVDIRNPERTSARIGIAAEIKHEFLRPILPQHEDVRISDWRLHTEELAVDIKGSGKEFSAALTGAIVLDHIRARIHGTDYRNLEVRQQFKVRCHGLRATDDARRMAGNIDVGDTFFALRRTGVKPKDLVRVDFSGGVDLAPRNAKAKAVLRLLDLREIHGLLPATLGLEELEGWLKAAVSLEAEDFDRVLTARADLAFENCRVAVKDQPRLPHAVSLNFVVDGSYKDHHLLQLKEARLQVAGKGRDQLVTFAAAGNFDTRLEAQTTCRLEATMEKLDLTRLQALLPANLGVKRLAGMGSGVLVTTQGNGKRVAVECSATLDGFEYAAGKGSLPEPLDADFNVDVDYNEAKILTVNDVAVKVTGRRQKVYGEAKIHGSVNASEAGGKSELQCRLNVPDLAAYRPIVPARQGLEQLAGSVLVSLKAMQEGKELKAEGEARLENFDLAVRRRGRLQRPCTAIALLNGVYHVAGKDRGMIDVSNISAAVLDNQQKQLLGLVLKGRVDGQLKGRRSNLTLTADEAVDLSAAEAVWIKAAPAKAARTAGEVAADRLEKPLVEVAEESRLANFLKRQWIDLEIGVAEVRYRDVRLHDFSLNGVLKDNRLTLSKCSTGINGGSLSVAGSCRLNRIRDMGYEGTFKGADIPGAPILKAMEELLDFMPAELHAAIKTIDGKFAGQGTAARDVLRTLDARINYELEDIAVTRVKGALPADRDLNSKQLAAVIGAKILFIDDRNKRFADVFGTALQVALKKGDYPLEKLKFDRGPGELVIKGGAVDIKHARFLSEDLRLRLHGRIAIGGKWFTILNVKPTISARRAAKIDDLQMKARDDGYFELPPVAYRGYASDSKTYAPFLIEVVARYNKDTGKYLQHARSADDLQGALNELLHRDGDKKEARKKLTDSLIDIGMGALKEYSDKKRRERDEE